MNKQLSVIKDHRIIVIYRGHQPEECLEISQVLMDAGIRLFEVTMNTPNAIEAIRLLNAELGQEALIGAGTVLTADEVDMAANAGASYIISPNVNIEVIQRTKELGLISIPGAFTPTEIMNAREAGADMIKIFPINVVGAEYITQIKGPLDQIPFVPSGGIKFDLVEELFQAGSSAVGVGVHLFGKELLESKDWETLRSKAEEFRKAAGVTLTV
jgi:2-dehydro-3-deoxyphosphogluconate aldolase/(4S)-4-hydroxy-2-oxoglutarate aldolase